MNQSIKTQLLPAAEHQADEILQQYNHARTYLEQTLEQEAEDKIAGNCRLQSAVEQKVEAYNQAIAGINSCLQAMQLYEHLLPALAKLAEGIGQSDFSPVSPEPEAFNFSPVGVSDSNGIVDVIEVRV